MTQRSISKARSVQPRFYLYLLALGLIITSRPIAVNAGPTIVLGGGGAGATGVGSQNVSTGFGFTAKAGYVLRLSDGFVEAIPEAAFNWTHFPGVTADNVDATVNFVRGMGGARLALGPDYFKPFVYAHAGYGQGSRDEAARYGGTLSNRVPLTPYPNASGFAFDVGGGVLILSSSVRGDPLTRTYTVVPSSPVFDASIFFGYAGIDADLGKSSGGVLRSAQPSRWMELGLLVGVRF